MSNPQEPIRERQTEITRSFERLDNIDHEQNALIARIRFLLEQDETDAAKPGEAGE